MPNVLHLFIEGNVEFSSGKQYWEVKIDRMPHDEEDLIIGVGVLSDKIIEGENRNYAYSWGYQVLSGKKTYQYKNNSTNIYEEELEPYGYICKAT